MADWGMGKKKELRMAVRMEEKKKGRRKRRVKEKEKGRRKKKKAKQAVYTKTTVITDKGGEGEQAGWQTEQTHTHTHTDTEQGAGGRERKDEKDDIAAGP